MNNLKLVMSSVEWISWNSLHVTQFNLILITAHIHTTSCLYGTSCYEDMNEIRHRGACRRHSRYRPWRRGSAHER